jgi:hypothetical protein
MLSVTSKLLLTKALGTSASATSPTSPTAAQSASAATGRNALNQPANTPLQPQTQTATQDPRHAHLLAQGQSALSELPAFTHSVANVGQFSRMLDGWDKYSATPRHQRAELTAMTDTRKTLGSTLPATPDMSARVELWSLDRSRGPVTGEGMMDAIERGLADFDGKGAAKEFNQFAQWAHKNASRLTPEANQVLGLYAKHARKAQAKGESDIPLRDFFKMLGEMKGVKGVKEGSVPAELARLDGLQGPISGDQMADAIRHGSKASEGAEAADEFHLFNDWANKNAHRMTPEARRMLETYGKVTGAAGANVPESERSMTKQSMPQVRDLRTSMALLELSLQPGRVSGRDMLGAIRRSMGDMDGKSVTDEYKLIADWARANPAKLSPEAERVMDIYTRFNDAARARGRSGISFSATQQMLREMREAAQPERMPAAAFRALSITA